MIIFYLYYYVSFEIFIFEINDKMVYLPSIMINWDGIIHKDDSEYNNVVQIINKYESIEFETMVMNNNVNQCLKYICIDCRPFEFAIL